jgi:hypothetical protein
VSQIASPARYLITLLAALLRRAFLNYPIPIVRLRRNAQTVVLLQAVFRPLGQTRAVALGADWPVVQRTLSARNFCG